MKFSITTVVAILASVAVVEAGNPGPQGPTCPPFCGKDVADNKRRGVMDLFKGFGRREGAVAEIQKDARDAKDI